MSTDPRDRASETAAHVAGQLLAPVGEVDQRVARARIATGDPSQVEQLADAIAVHCSALPRKHGIVSRLTVYDGDSPIAEFEGGGGAALDVARFLVMRATLEGKRLSFTLGVQVEGGEREITKWRFPARPDVSGGAVMSDPAAASSWNAVEAAKLQAIHNHQLVQELIAQSRLHGAQIQEQGRAAAEIMRSVGESSTALLKQMARWAEVMGERTRRAEDVSADAQREARELAAATSEAVAAMDVALNEAERIRREAEEDPTRKVVEGAVRGISEGLKLRVAGGSSAPPQGTEGAA